jgi:hypothetical protein
MSREQRRATRVATAIRAELDLDGQRPLGLVLQNLSLVGLLGTAQMEIVPGTACRVRLAAGEHTAEARGRVVRSHGLSLALRFDVLPFESLEPLRRLLLAHAEDPIVVENELNERLGHLGEGA